MSEVTRLGDLTGRPGSGLATPRSLRLGKLPLRRGEGASILPRLNEEPARASTEPSAYEVVRPASAA